MKAELYTICSVLLFALALIAFLVRSGVFYKILSLNIMGIGVFMLLLSTSAYYPNEMDPITHALVLTGIVVAVAGTALALNLAAQIDLPSPHHEQDSCDKHH